VQKASTWGKFKLVPFLGSEETPFVKTQTTAITKSTDVLHEVDIRLHVIKNL